VLFLLVGGGLLVFETELPKQYGGFGECGSAGLSYSVSLSVVSSLYPVGPPLFTVPQIIVVPGSTARINVTYTGATEAEVSLSNPFYGYSGNVTHPSLFIGLFDKDQSTNSSEVTITHGLFVVHSNTTISQIFTISVSPAANWATYGVGGVGCTDSSGFLLTVGVLPYWQPVYWLTQPATPITCLVIAALVAALVAGSVRLIHRIGQIEIG
jgi:hypothetical protein